MSKHQLLDSQAGFYYGTKIGDDKSSYNIAEYVEINHTLDIARMKRVIHRVISQTPTLHVLFDEDNGTPYQYPVTANISVEWVDLSQRANNMATAIELMEADAKRPFSLNAAPLFRQKIIRLGEQRFLWYFCSHHLLLDGYGTYLLIHQVAQAYRGQTQQPQDVPAIDALLRAESEYKQSAAYQADRHFWQAASASLPDPMTLACANIPSGQTIRHVTSLPYPAERLALQTGHPSWLARTFVAVMAYLYLCTGEKQQTIGVPMMARTDSLTRQALTCKTNVVPLTLDIEDTASCRQLAQTIERVLRQLKKHQAFRYEEIKSLRSVTSRSPLFNIVVNIIPFEAAASFSSVQRSEIRNLRSGGAQDLVFNMRPDLDNQTLRLEIDADSGLYDAASLVRHSQGIQTLCALLYHDPENLSVAALRQRFPLSLQGKAANENVVDIMQRIDRAVVQAPQRTAILTPAHASLSLRALSYAVLQQQWRALADTLAPARAAYTVLLLDLPQGPEAIICMLAALQLKMPFVNLNAKGDGAAHRQLLEQFSDAILITDRTLPSFHSEPDALAHWRASTLDMPADFAHFTVFRRQTAAEVPPFPAGTGYIMFTSGSTGMPKGVIGARHALNVFVDAAIKCYGIQPHERVLQFAPLHFDACIEEIFMTLGAGAHLCIAPEAVKHSFAAFFTFCADHQISLLDLPTAYFNEMLFASGGEQTLPPAVTTVIIGGESLSPRSKESWFAHYPKGRKLFNSYGPTETTVVATVAEIKNDGAAVTIGAPLDGIYTAIVGEDLRLLPLGCSGELLIAGATVSLGYLHQPTLSAEKFVTLEVNGHPMPAFRTGDIACQRQDGQLVFLGRKIREAKIAGQRVNMGEIESCLARLPAIVEIAVLAKSGDAGTELYAHYHSRQPLSEAMRRTLYGELPNAHIPQRFVHHPTPLAKLANGKIDYRTLERQSRLPEPTRELRSTTFNTLVNEVWLATLGSDDGDFFTLGGESLQAIKIINALNAHCRLDLNLSDIFEHPRLTDFCRHLTQLAHARYGLDPQHLDIRCAIGRRLSTEAPASSRLFIQSPEGADERLLLAALADKHGVDILSPQALPLHAEWPLNAAIFNVPNEATQYASWLDALSALQLVLPGRVNYMIFMHDTAGGARLTQSLLRDFRHERLLLLHKTDSRRQAVDAGVTELIAFSARLGYFPHIRFDTANERLNGCVLRIFGFDDGENIDHRAAFTMAQRRNPGVQLCSLSHWLNLISAHSDKRPNKSGRTGKAIDVNMEGVH